MVRLLSIMIECFSSLVFVVPAIFIWQYAIIKQRGFKRLLLCLIFSFYLTAVFFVVGIPTVTSLRLDPGFNVIPLMDIFNSPLSYLKNTILNVILFMPLGFLLPAGWSGFRSLKKTVLTGLSVSVLIEVLQIFTFRLTDIDDLITNTLGAFLGYYVWKVFEAKRSPKVSNNQQKVFIKYEPFILLILTFLIGFFLKSFVSGKIWEWVFSSSLWERIK